MKEKQKRKLAAILFADIVGYTSLMQANEAHTFQIIKRYQTLLEAAAIEFNGQVLKNYGDGSLMTFSNSVDAVKAAMQIQTQAKTEPTVPLRIGIHIGEFIVEKNDIFGNGVNLASRIESLGISGAVLFSKNIFQKIKNHPELKVQSLGSFDFKNVGEPMEVFAIANGGFPVPKRAEMKGKLNKKQGNYFSKLSLLVKGLALLGALLLSLVLSYFFMEINNPNSIKSEKTIAVLPLKNLTSSGEDFEYFSDGLTQEVIDELSKIKLFRVSAFTQSSYYKSQNKSPQEIAKELDVDFLISGTSRIIEDSKRIKLSIELFNPFTNERLWNASFNKEMKDAYLIQTEIAKKIAANLNITLSQTEKEALEQINTTDGDAFRLLLNAKSEVAKLTPKGLLNSQSLLKDAIQLDPNYTQAHTLLAWSYSLTGDPLLMPNAMSTKESAHLIDPHLDKSIELDPYNSDIYLVQAASNLWVKNQIRDAVKDVELSLQLNSWPRIPTNFCICTAVATYVASSDIEKAKSISHIAKKVDPGNVFINWEQGNISMLEGDYKVAHKHFQKTVEDLDIPYFNTYLGWSYFHAGKYEEALTALHRAYDDEELPLIMTAAYLSNSYYLLGNLEKSNEYLNELIDRDAAGEHHINLYLTMIYSARKDVSKALITLETAWDKKEYGIAVATGSDPVFKILHKEPRFQEIRKKMQYYE